MDERPTNAADLQQEWSNLAGPWTREMRAGRNANRAGLLDGHMLEACGDVAGLRVLDSGCGEGRFCRILAERGAAYVLGLDLCEPLIAAARQLPSPGTEYRVADVQDLGFLDDGAFDLVVSYLNQCDLPDFEANTREAFRVLRPGGRFVVCTVHPMRSSVGGWHRDAAGAKQHVILDRYFDEGERQWTMMGCEFTNFHRTLQTFLDAYVRTGFAIQRVVEPTATPEMLAEWPEIDDEARVPNFVIFQLAKL